MVTAHFWTLFSLFAFRCSVRRVGHGLKPLSERQGGGPVGAGAASAGDAASSVTKAKAAKVAGDLTGMVKEMFGADVDVDLRGSLASS